MSQGLQLDSKSREDSQLKAHLEYAVNGKGFTIQNATIRDSQRLLPRPSKATDTPATKATPLPPTRSRA